MVLCLLTTINGKMKQPYMNSRKMTISTIFKHIFPLSCAKVNKNV